jgi:hypothetical protein
MIVSFSLGRGPLLPSGKLSHNELENHHFSWVNPLFLWPFSIAMFVYQSVREGKRSEMIWRKVVEIFRCFFKSGVAGTDRNVIVKNDQITVTKLRMWGANELAILQPDVGDVD